MGTEQVPEVEKALDDAAYAVVRKLGELYSYMPPGGIETRVNGTFHAVRAALAAAEARGAEREREACALLHESARTWCDHEPPAGAGAMGALISYRDLIRARGAEA